MWDAIPFLPMLGRETFFDTLFSSDGGDLYKLVCRRGIAKALEHGNGILQRIRFDIEFFDSSPQLVVEDKMEYVDFPWLSVVDSSPLMLDRIEEVLDKWAWGLGREDASSMSSPLKVLAQST